PFGRSTVASVLLRGARSLLDQEAMSGRLGLATAVLVAELALPVAAQAPPGGASPSPGSAAVQPSPPTPQGSAAAGQSPVPGSQEQRQQENASAAAAAGAGAVIVGTQLDAKEDPFAFPAPTVRARQWFGYAS